MDCYSWAMVKKESAVKDDDRNGECQPMPEHSETTPTPSMSESIATFMAALSTDRGARIVAASVDDTPLHDGTWIVTTTTAQGYREVWLVPATPDATP